MVTVVECQVCGDEVGRGPAGLGLKQHAKMHRREFRETFGREPEDYQEVRDVLGDGQPLEGGMAGPQMTLWEALTDDEQAALGRST